MRALVSALVLLIDRCTIYEVVVFAMVVVAKTLGATNMLIQDCEFTHLDSNAISLNGIPFFPIMLT